MNNNCIKCSKRIPRYQPRLICDICNTVKHAKCENLSRLEATHIVNSSQPWTCHDCITDILPINLDYLPRQIEPLVPRFKVKCTTCSGWSYSRTNVRTCYWCESTVHKKCFKDSLGCVSCCESMIPGFHTTYYELYDDYTSLNNILYNPYNQSHFSNQIGDMLDDAEQNDTLWNETSELLLRCKYKQLNHFQQSRNGELQIFSHNIRSLTKNIHKIRENITTYQKFDLLMFNETNLIFDKLPNGMNDLILDGFHEPIIQTPIRRSGRGGGLAIFVNKRVCEYHNIQEFNPNPDPACAAGEFQFVKLHKCLGTNRTLILGNVYRSPAQKNCEPFNNLLESVVQNLNRHSRKQIYIVGDLNMDLIRHDSDTHCQKLIDNMSRLGFVQTVSRPTRITEHSHTLLDHVYTNNIDHTLSCNIATTDMSDHLATITKISLGNTAVTITNRTKSENRNIEHRIFNESSDCKFNELMQAETWDQVFSSNDAQSQYNTFCDIYTSHYNTAYPLKSEHKRRKTERKNPKAWVLPWLEEACARKNKLYHTFMKHPTVANKAAYVKLNKFVNKHTKLAKNKYYKKYFDQYTSNSKMQWNMVNTLLGRKLKRNDPITLKDSTGNLVKSPSEVASKFNEYFANIASNLKSQMNQNTVFDPGGFRDFLKTPTMSPMCIKPAQPGEIHTIIKNFKNKSTLDTKISALKIANTSFQFTHALAKLISFSFEQGIFPQQLKTARVVPILKSGPKTDVSNYKYRPISLLSSFSKIYEKLMHNRLLEFLDSNGSLFEMQYGFRPGRSCEHALLNAQNTLLNSLNRNQISLLLLIDFSKAFDMVDHTILLHKLYHYGVRGTAFKWFKSYLDNRQQFVTINGSDSTRKHMQYGVPQGSILGPLLFVIYINDLPGISEFAKFIMYADDANIIITGVNMDEIYNKVVSLTQRLVRWVGCNGLALNLKKTNYMIFSRQRNLQNRELYINSNKIERVHEARFLGVIVDDRLLWSKHISTVKAKMCKYIGIMYKIKHHLPLKARLQIYHSFVQSHINYCSLVWGFAAKSHIESLFVTQKKAMRAIMPGYVNYFYKDGQLPTSTKSSFNEHKVLTVHSIIVKNALTFMHRTKHFPNSYPSSITQIIPPNAPTNGSDHDTAADWLLHYNNHTYRPSIFYKGPLLATTLHYTKTLKLSGYLSYKAHALTTKHYMLTLQSGEDDDEWPNFLLYSIPGLRHSNRLQQN